MYCICPASVGLAPLGRGLGGAKLRALPVGRLAAVYSRHRSLQIRPEAEQVLGHERVIESFLPRDPVLPLRFGTRFEREQQLVDVLVRRGDELSALLEQVRGHVELGVRVIPTEADTWVGPARPPNGPPPSSGRDALLARVARHNRVQEISLRLHAPLAELAAASTVREFPRPPALLVSSYLVGDGHVDTFRRRAAQLAAAQPDVRVLITGPWPPYSFAEAGR